MVILGKISCPWRLVYATRARVCGASAAHWTSARLPLRPPAAPSSHTPLGKSIPRLIKSSTHFRPRFLQELKRYPSWQYPKLAYFRHRKPSVATISPVSSIRIQSPVVIFEVLDKLLPYLRNDSTKIGFATIIIASRSRGPGEEL